MNHRIVTAESVRRGHPDKFCDQVADRILDAHLAGDPNARVAVEVFATADKVLVAGEVTSTAQVNYRRIVWETIGEIGYQKADLCPNSMGHVDVDVYIHEQSPDIAQAVNGCDELGAGDQGIMVGYATDETPEYMPLPAVLAHALCKRLDALSKNIYWLGADGKAQVTVAYDGDVSAERFSKMLAGYEREQAELATRMDSLQPQIAEAEDQALNTDRFLRLVKSYTEIDTLTAEVVSEFIEKIVIGETMMVQPRRFSHWADEKRQNIRIVYNYVGDVPQEVEPLTANANGKKAYRE